MIKVQSVQPQPDYWLKVTFNNNETKFFNVAPYLDKGIFKELKNEELINISEYTIDSVHDLFKLSSTTATSVLSCSKATRDRLKSFRCIGTLHRLVFGSNDGATPSSPAPIASLPKGEREQTEFVASLVVHISYSRRVEQDERQK